MGVTRNAKRAAAAATDNKAKNIKIQSDTNGTNIVYIGHIPHGFYENQMQGYFSQFGTVKNVRLSRNKRTGKSKHYAFVQFESEEVARIAAEAMNGYMMFKQKLTAHVMTADAVHPRLFKRANKPFVKIPWRKIERARHNDVCTRSKAIARTQKLLKRDELRRQKIKQAGIEYEYEPLVMPVTHVAKKIRFEDLE